MSIGMCDACVCVRVACVRACVHGCCVSVASVCVGLSRRIGLRAEMMVGMPTIISAPDANPERKFQRRDGGMQSF